MRKSSLLILLTTICFQLLGFEIKGNPKTWEKEDFIGFDKVGDCKSQIGDISSVFTRIETDKLFLRITFDDMYSHRSKVDYFTNEDIQISLVITTGDTKLFDDVFEIDKTSKNEELRSFLRTSEYNLFEMKIDWSAEQSRENLFFNIDIFHNQNLVDEYSADGSEDYRGGNAAFVHHGNQGLTYTEVFYGQEPLESSGFDEILEVHQATQSLGIFTCLGR